MLIKSVERSEQTVCIVSPSRDIYSETFIKAHIERLPAKVIPIYGYPFPNQTIEGEFFYPSSSVNYVLNKLGKRIFNLSEKRLHAKEVKKFLINQRVDIVLAEFGHTGVSMMEICEEANLPLFVHFHGHDAYRKNILNSVGERYPKLFNYASGLIVVSRDMRDQLVRLGAPIKKIHLNPYGVDTHQFYGGNPSKAPLLFVAIGRFVDKKAPHLTILAFYEMMRDFPDAQLILHGDGPLLEACMNLVEALSISHAVEFRGSTTHSEVADTMRRARGFVQHSILTSAGDSEGTPVAVIEASATGLPVVATKHAGISDVILDGETGLLVPEKDISSMANAMKLLAKDPEFAGKLGNNGRVRVIESYSMDGSIARLWDIIQNMTKSDRYH